MARRGRSRGPEVTLFPFLSVLAAVMGTLILLISGMSQLALANPKQRVEVELDSPDKKNPVYIECTEEGLFVYPDDPTSGPPAFVSTEDIRSPTGAWAALARSFEHDPKRYPLLLVRASGVDTFQQTRDTLAEYAVDLGYEPLFGDGAVRFSRRIP